MTRITTLPRLLGATAVALTASLALTTAAHAQAVNTDGAGVALSGHDAVSYFTDSAAVKGAAEFTATYQGATYRFASAAHLHAFEADPAKYAPLYGGYCAYGVANGHKVKIDPEAFRVYEGRLYFNYSKGVQKQWLKDIPGNIAAAERNWPELQDKPHD